MDTPAHLLPSRQRGGTEAPRTTPRAGSAPTIADAVDAMIRSRRDWGATQKVNIRGYLVASPNARGHRFASFCEAEGVTTIDQLTTEHIERFMASQADLVSNETLRKYRTHFRALAAFQKETTGYGRGLVGIERVRAPKQIKWASKVAPCLSGEEEHALVAAADSERDRLIIETMLACGLRVSELCGLRIEDVQVPARALPHLIVRGSSHDPQSTKSGHDRKVPFRPSYNNLPRRLAAYIAARESDVVRREVFLSSRRDHMGPKPLTIWGVEDIVETTAKRAHLQGVHPHKLRHTWATRCVEGGVNMFALQEAGGWQSVDMVRRYFRAADTATLEAFARSTA